MRAKLIEREGKRKKKRRRYKNRGIDRTRKEIKATNGKGKNITVDNANLIKINQYHI